jgi:hypothetical protein
MDQELSIKMSDSSSYIILDRRIYDLEAICLAAVARVDDFYVFLEVDESDENMVRLFLEPKDGAWQEGQAKSAFGLLRNDLLDNVLRVELSKRNQRIRDYVVGTALVSAISSQSSLTGGINPEEDWQSDPYNIFQAK